MFIYSFIGVFFMRMASDGWYQSSVCPKRVPFPSRAVLPPSQQQMTLLSYSDGLFRERLLALFPSSSSSKFTGHVFAIHQYPHWVSTPIYDWPTCARDPIQIGHIWAARIESRIKKKNIAKATPPINPGLFFSLKASLFFFFLFQTWLPKKAMINTNQGRRAASIQQASGR